MKFEYTGSCFRIVVEFFRLRPVFAKYQVTGRRRDEVDRRKLLRKVIHRIGEVEE